MFDLLFGDDDVRDVIDAALYVSEKTGSDESGDGSEAKPFKTAISVRRIFLANPTSTEVVVISLLRRLCGILVVNLECCLWKAVAEEAMPEFDFLLDALKHFFIASSDGNQ